MTNKKPILKTQNQKYTQAELVLAVLQSRKTVTTDILEDLGIKCPSAVICKLNNSGYRIESELICSNTSGLSNKKRQAEYKLITSPEPTSQTSDCTNNATEEM
ncbi:hypothetical protein MACH16_18460 [Marinomonas pontica]|uniref:Winged helix-turn-helix domain-containing protein n=1 Tax=Marinomonas pontica TaxID=264739 RepID=A0ABM8FDB8_9GAMM|nr:hypothetical protein MACH16_18460 [Marinomonas pontica]